MLWDHNPERVVGHLDAETGIMTFEPRTVTSTMMFNAGWRVLDQEIHEGVVYITRAELMELSVG